mmetsp:Transcript_85968/g.196028  ORF Transcript_85968/g.196028 Transcript_85968/m.196028 type:complete len:110 (+) Transcript_85968:68-397(+)
MPQCSLVRCFVVLRCMLGESDACIPMCFQLCRASPWTSTVLLHRGGPGCVDGSHFCCVKGRWLVLLSIARVKTRQNELMRHVFSAVVVCCPHWDVRGGRDDSFVFHAWS